MCIASLHSGASGGIEDTTTQHTCDKEAHRQTDGKIEYQRGLHHMGISLLLCCLKLLATDTSLLLLHSLSRLCVFDCGLL